MRAIHTVAAWGLCGALAAVVSAGEPVAKLKAPTELVKARLIADVEAVQVGKPFTVGVLLTIEPDWHIYWKHPGDAGMATSVKFKVPAGYSVGPVSWPRPVTFEQPGKVIGYGYKGQVLLTATVTPLKAKPKTKAKADPSAGPLTLSAEVDWLACRDKCIPGRASLKLAVKAVADAKDARTANAKTFQAWADRVDPVAPGFVLKDQDGKRVSLAGLKGKVVVLEWFNPDCPFVKRHHVTKSTMVDLAGKYSAKGVVWLAVNSTHYMDVWASKKWRDTWKLPYPVLVDRDGAVGRAFGAKSTPHMFVISPVGRIVYQGAIDDDPPGRKKAPTNYVDLALTALLAAEPVNAPQTKSYGCSVKYAPKGKKGE